MTSPKQQTIMNNAMEIIGNEGINRLTTAHLSKKIGINDGVIWKISYI